MPCRFTILLICGLLYFNAFATKGRPSYSAFLIPMELKKDADAVVRIESDQMQVYKSNKATLTRHIVITVLNQKGSDAGYEKIFYDKFKKVKRISGRLYDENGNLVRALSSSDIKDYSISDDFSVFIDARVKVAGFRHQSYPYTVELSYEIAFNGLIMIPEWNPADANTAIEKAEYFFVTENEMACRFQKNGALTFSGPLKKNNQTTYHWTLEKFHARKREPYSPPLAQQNPYVKIVMSEFKIEGYDGDGRDWKSLGSFIYNLNSNRNELTKDVIAEVRSIASAEATKKDKVKALYNYLQQTTRYVNISLGIGGWQTHDAKYVCKNKYGDCKALTNYMRSILSSAGVESYQALINAGEADGTVEGFPSLHFNHVILFVPDGRDTIWLECTSQKLPFGVLSNSCEDRWALALHADKSCLVRTPASKPADNVASSKAVVRLNRDGSAAAKVTLKFKGAYAYEAQYIFVDKPKKEQEQWIAEMLDLPALQIHEYTIQDLKAIGEVELTIAVDFPQYASTSASKLFLQLNLLSRQKSLPESTGQREQNVIWKRPNTNTDTIIYQLPSGVKLESLKKDPSEIKSDFGDYSSSVTVNETENSITYVRNLVMNRFDFPAVRYEEFRNFFADVVKKDQLQAILAK